MVSKTCWFLKLKTAKNQSQFLLKLILSLKDFAIFCCCMKVSFSTIEWKCFWKLKNGIIIGNYFCPEILRGNWSNMWWLLPQYVRVCACVRGCGWFCACASTACVCVCVRVWRSESKFQRRAVSNTFLIEGNSLNFLSWNSPHVIFWSFLKLAFFSFLGKIDVFGLVNIISVVSEVLFIKYALLLLKNF